eukprot:g10036.t1
MALLDACYPFAHKAGLLTDEAVGLKGSEPTQGTCACAVLLLPGALGSAVNLCGVRPLAELPVFDADLRRGIIRTVEDLLAAAVPGDRKPSISAAEAIQEIAKDAGVREADLWVGLPRVASRDSAQLRVAPGAGEWALYPWGLVSVEGSLLLQANPRAEGVCHKTIDRALGRLGRAYDLNALATSESSEVPYARLCFAAGPGPIKSVDNDVQLVAFGQALIGCPGTSYPFSGELKRPITTMHRQALGLVMLYSAPSLVPKASGALDTGLWSPLRSKRKQLPFGRSLCYLKSTTPQRPLLVPEVTSHVLGPRGMVFDSEAWLEDVQQKIPDKEAKIVIGCAAGVRSKAAARVLEAAGYLNVQELDDGFNGWAASGHPVGPLAK